MKISVKTEPETPFLIHRLVLDSAQTTTGRTSGKSMKVELFEILSKRCISYSSNPNGKPREISFRYHLADELLKCIIKIMSHPSLGIYEQNKLEMFKNQLFEKLI